MKRIRPQRDIRSVSEFRSNAASLIEQIQQDHHPLVLTQHGSGAAVVLSVIEYDRMVGEIELLRDIAAARTELAAGGGVDHEEARARLLERLER